MVHVRALSEHYLCELLSWGDLESAAGWDRERISRCFQWALWFHIWRGGQCSRVLPWQSVVRQCGVMGTRKESRMRVEWEYTQYNNREDNQSGVVHANCFIIRGQYKTLSWSNTYSLYTCLISSILGQYKNLLCGQTSIHYTTILHKLHTLLLWQRDKKRIFHHCCSCTMYLNTSYSEFANGRKREHRPSHFYQATWFQIWRRGECSRVLRWDLLQTP